jgi:hypothetical protein
MAIDVWELDQSAPDWLESIIVCLLEVGVPPTALSRAFRVSVEPIKELQAQLYVQKYGTAEISEGMNFLMWRAYQDALSILDNAPSATRTRFITTLLSRQSVILGKESPQSLERMRNEFNSLIASIGVEDPTIPSIYATSEFTPLDREANDPEERLDR